MDRDSVGFIMISTPYCHHKGSFCCSNFQPSEWWPYSGWLPLKSQATVFCVSHADIKSKGKRQVPSLTFPVWVSCLRIEETFSRSLQENSVHSSGTYGMSSCIPITGRGNKNTILDLEINYLRQNGCWTIKHQDEYRFQLNTSKITTAFLVNHAHFASGN